MRGRHVGECERQCLSAMTTVAYCMRLAALDWSYSDLMMNGHDQHGSSSVLPLAVFRSREEMEEKVTPDTVVHCNIFRLFVVNIVLL